MPKNNPKGYSSMMDSNQMHKSGLAQPSSVYSQKFDNATLGVVKRTDKIDSKEAGKIRNQEFKGRYS